MPKGVTAPREIKCDCGTLFMGTHGGAKYCSDACRRDGERKSWREYGHRNLTTRRQYHRGNYEKNRETVLARTKAYQRSPAGKAAQRKNDERQRERFPEKIAARGAVKNALRSGGLVREPCACGATKVHGHHDDYSKPLEVRWLCEPCHRAEHKKRELENL